MTKIIKFHTHLTLLVDNFAGFKDKKGVLLFNVFSEFFKKSNGIFVALDWDIS